MSSVKLFNYHIIWQKEKIKHNKTQELKLPLKYSCVVLREELDILMDSLGYLHTSSDEPIIDEKIWNANEQISLN